MRNIEVILATLYLLQHTYKSLLLTLYILFSDECDNEEIDNNIKNVVKRFLMDSFNVLDVTSTRVSFNSSVTSSSSIPALSSQNKGI